ncbi:MAG: hypothetical protein JSS68_11665 [Actinobacteria bacterium]|nr:hypothetical protein [Actinomycetota bacterium]
MNVTFISTVLAGGIAGATAGGLLTWCSLRRHKKSSRPVSDPSMIDPNVLRDINRAAKAWADSQGQSDTVAGMVADKLRLVYELSVRRNRP